MPERVVLYCKPCTKAQQRLIEVMDVTFWIDENRSLYFITSCDCGNSETVKTSTEELAAKYYPMQQCPAPGEPTLVM